MSAELFKLDGKVALVTGAGSGLGREMALGLAAAGCDVICADRDKGWVTETVSIIHSTGGKASRIVFDVANADEVAHLGRAVKSSHGKLDVLINNAGVAPYPKRLHEVDPADWRRVVDVNLHGPFLVTRAVLPLMLEARAGSIINVASLIGIGGFYPGHGGVERCLCGDQGRAGRHDEADRGRIRQRQYTGQRHRPGLAGCRHPARGSLQGGLERRGQAALRAGHRRRHPDGSARRAEGIAGAGDLSRQRRLDAMSPAR